MTCIPGFEKYIVTASQESTDVWGCTDQAIRFFDADCTAEEVARRDLMGRWREMLEDYDQSRWAYLFNSTKG